MFTYNVIYNAAASLKVSTQEATIYSFSKYDPRIGVYPVQGSVIDVSGKLIYNERIDNALKQVLNNQISTYIINPFILTTIENNTPVFYKTHSWNIDSETAFKETLIGADVPLDGNGMINNSIFIVLNNEDTFGGYIYKYGADITSRVWGIEDYCKSILAMYEPVTDTVFEYSELDSDNVIIDGSIFTIIVHDTVSYENKIYTYNYSTYGASSISLKVEYDISNDSRHILIIISDGDNSPTAKLPINATEIITILTYNGKGYSLENLQARRLRYTPPDEANNIPSTWIIGSCLVHLPPLNKLGYLFSNTLTPWFDLKLSTITMDKLIITYTITKAIPMLALYKYTEPHMIYSGDIINSNESKLIDIIDNHDGHKYTDLQINSWHGITLVNTKYFIELDIRTSYFAEYDYYEAFDLTLEFS